MLTFPYASRQQRLKAYVRTAVTVHLFTNEVMPTGSTAVADFVEPDAATGYAPVALVRAAWRFEAVGPAVRAVSAPVRFTLPTGRAVVRGHYAVNADGELVWSEVLMGALPEALPGDAVQYVPVPFEFLRPTDALEVKMMIDSLDLQAATAAES